MEELDVKRRLEVVQLPQLFQQFGDFVMDRLCIANDEAQCGCEGANRSRAAG